MIPSIGTVLVQDLGFLPTSSHHCMRQTNLQRQWRLSASSQTWKAQKPKSRAAQFPVRKPRKNTGKGGNIETIKQPERPQQALKPAAESPLLPASDLLSFERKGHLVIRSMLSKAETAELGQEVKMEVDARRLEALRHRVRVLCPDSNPGKIHSEAAALQELERNGSEPVGFLQTFNMWRNNEVIKSYAHLLAPMAAQLMGCKAVRLYQDCAFLKEPGFGSTNWHSDLRMAPLDTNHFVTAWIPLRDIKGKNDTGLTFASGSHRDFALPFWHHSELEDMDLTSRGYPISSTGAMSLGDVSWHSGWTLHQASPLPRGAPPRLALSLSFFRDGARTLPKKAARQVHQEDRESFKDWRREVKDGALARHALLPLLQPPQPSDLPNNAGMPAGEKQA